MKSKLRINPLFLLPVAVLWYSLGWIWTAGYLGALFCHELSHVYIARQVGLDKASLHLGAFGCKAQLEGLDCCEAGRELPIALAGPVFNLFVAH